MQQIDWTPNDYSPTYQIEVDENYDFVRLIAIFNLPPEYPEAKNIPIEDGYIEYAEKAWNKNWLRDALRTSSAAAMCGSWLRDVLRKKTPDA